MMLHLQTVPARNGLLWIRHGLKVFQRRPMALASLFASFVFLALALTLLPHVGLVLVLMALPLLSLGFMLATHLVLQDKTPTAAVFIAPLRLTAERRRTQLLLGAGYALAALLITVLSGWISGGTLDQLQAVLAEGGKQEEIDALTADPRLAWGAFSRLLLTALVAVPFWHAPALVHWGGQGLLQSLFSSTLGVWRNRGAFVYNIMLWGAMVFALSLLLSLILGILGLGQYLAMLAMPLGLLISTVFYASLYFSFIDCFMFGAPRDLLSEKKD